jgi:hypothetical protein
VGKKEPLYTAGRTPSSAITLEKNLKASKYSLNIDLPYDPVIPFLGIYPNECNTGYSKGICTPMFIAALFKIAVYGNNQIAPLLLNESRKCGIYTQWSFTQL